MLSAFAILIFAIFVAVFIVPVPKGYRILATANFFIFLVFAYIFSTYTGNADRGVDTLKFYLRGPISWNNGFESILQAQLMYFISGGIQSLFPISYLAFNFIGALLFSYVGLAIVFRMNPNPTKNTILAWWIFTMLPGMHFWHASFGKESLQFLTIACFFGLSRMPFKLAALGCLLILRPHIGVLLATAEIIRIAVSRKKKSDLFLVIAAATVCTYGIIFLVERLQGGNVSILQLFAIFTDYGADWTSSSLRLNDTSSILAYPDFFLRPYPHEIRSFFHLITAVENVIIVLLLLGAVVMGTQKRWIFTASAFILFLFILMPLINPNVGTSARKKQIFPLIALIIISTRRQVNYRFSKIPLPSRDTDNAYIEPVHFRQR